MYTSPEKANGESAVVDQDNRSSEIRSWTECVLCMTAVCCQKKAVRYPAEIVWDTVTGHAGQLKSHEREVKGEGWWAPPRQKEPGGHGGLSSLGEGSGYCYPCENTCDSCVAPRHPRHTIFSLKVSCGHLLCLGTGTTTTQLHGAVPSALPVDSAPNPEVFCLLIK